MSGLCGILRGGLADPLARGRADLIYYTFVRPQPGGRLFFDNRELEIKENYDSYTRLSEKVSC